MVTGFMPVSLKIHIIFHKALLDCEFQIEYLNQNWSSFKRETVIRILHLRRRYFHLSMGIQFKSNQIKFISNKYRNDIYTNIACIYLWAVNQKSRKKGEKKHTKDTIQLHHYHHHLHHHYQQQLQQLHNQQSTVSSTAIHNTSIIT